MDTQANPRKPAWYNVPVLLIYLGLAILMTWPLMTQISEVIAGKGTDVWIHQWTFWWIKEALSSGVSPSLVAASGSAPCSRRISNGFVLPPRRTAV